MLHSGHDFHTFPLVTSRDSRRNLFRILHLLIQFLQDFPIEYPSNVGNPLKVDIVGQSLTVTLGLAAICHRAAMPKYSVFGCFWALLDHPFNGEFPWSYIHSPPQKCLRSGTIELGGVLQVPRLFLSQSGKNNFQKTSYNHVIYSQDTIIYIYTHNM